MTHQLRYGIETVPGAQDVPVSQLFIDVPTAVLRRIADRQLSLHHKIGWLIDEEVLTVDPDNKRPRFKIDGTKVGNLADDDTRDKTMEAIAQFLEGVDVFADQREKDPKVDVELGTVHNRADEGRLGMHVNVAWPKRTAGHKLNAVVSSHMISVARSLRYTPLADVYANVDRQRGATLQTGEILSCSIDTDGNHYNPEDERMVLTQHNVYSYAQQLILTAGAVALGHADELKPIEA